MSFLPKEYTIPKPTEEDKVDFLVGQARAKKSWAIMKLHNEYGLGDNHPSQGEVCGEPPVDYNLIK